MARERAKNEERQRKLALLLWSSRVTGLPLRHISQVQNGAVFCYLLSHVCDLDLTLVNYEAEEECECMANFRLLQAAARAQGVPGLNPTAKLAHWARLATCEHDAWAFLRLLHRCLRDAGRDGVEVKIAADSTPPPPPAACRKAQQARQREAGAAAGLSSSGSSAAASPPSARSRSPGGSSEDSPLRGASLALGSQDSGSVLACLREEELQVLIQDARLAQREQRVQAVA